MLYMYDIVFFFFLFIYLYQKDNFWKKSIFAQVPVQIRTIDRSDGLEMYDCRYASPLVVRIEKKEKKEKKNKGRGGEMMEV